VSFCGSQTYSLTPDLASLDPIFTFNLGNPNTITVYTTESTKIILSPYSITVTTSLFSYPSIVKSYTFRVTINPDCSTTAVAVPSVTDQTFTIATSGITGTIVLPTGFSNSPYSGLWGSYSYSVTFQNS
jgi:hypothetical protein